MLWVSPPWSARCGWCRGADRACNAVPGLGVPPQPAGCVILHYNAAANLTTRHLQTGFHPPPVPPQLVQLCDALDAPRTLRQLDAALEAALQRPEDPVECSDDEADGDPLEEPCWEEDNVHFLTNTLLAAERWQSLCPRWFGAAVARLGACVMDVHNTEETRLQMQVGLPG